MHLPFSFLCFSLWDIYIWSHRYWVNVLMGSLSNRYLAGSKKRRKKRYREHICIQTSYFDKLECIEVYLHLRPKKKKLLCCPHPTKIRKNWVGRSGFGLARSLTYFFFFLRTVRELSFPIFFLKFLNGENSGGMQSKRIYKSCKCFLKPLNTNFCKFFAQIWHTKKKNKKKPDPVFSHFTVGRGEGNITIFFLALSCSWNDPYFHPPWTT